MLMIDGECSREAAIKKVCHFWILDAGYWMLDGGYPMLEECVNENQKVWSKPQEDVETHLQREIIEEI